MKPLPAWLKQARSSIGPTRTASTPQRAPSGYDRDLLTSDATIAWIEQEGLTLDDWTNFLVGRLLVEEWAIDSR